MSDLIYFDEYEQKLKAKTRIKPQTNLGIVFELKDLTGDYTKDFERVNFGKYLRQNPFRSNSKVQFKRNKIELVSTKTILPGQEIVLYSFPWNEDTYIRRMKEYKEKIRKQMLDTS